METRSEIAKRAAATRKARAERNQSVKAALAERDAARLAATPLDELTEALAWRNRPQWPNQTKHIKSGAPSKKLTVWLVPSRLGHFIVDARLRGIELDPLQQLRLDGYRHQINYAIYEAAEFGADQLPSREPIAWSLFRGDRIVDELPIESTQHDDYFRRNYFVASTWKRTEGRMEAAAHYGVDWERWRRITYLAMFDGLAEELERRR
jgi:hypothetical protein